VYQLEFGDDGVSDAGNLCQALARRVQYLREGAEAGNQVLGQRLGVLALEGAKEDEFQQLIVVQGLASVVSEALAKPFAVTDECSLADSLNPMACSAGVVGRMV
jgi:hypothetical protein